MEDPKLPEDAINLILAKVDPQEIIAIVQRHCPEWSLEEITQRVMGMISNQTSYGT